MITCGDYQSFNLRCVHIVKWTGSGSSQFRTYSERHCESKTRHQTLPITSPNINRFSTFLLTDSVLNLNKITFKYPTPPRLKHVAALSCEIWISEKWRQSEICIVINNKSRGSIAKHLRSDEKLHYTFITKSAGEGIFKIGEHLAKLRAKCFMCPIRLALLSWKMLISLDKLNSLCITNRNCY